MVPFEDLEEINQALGLSISHSYLDRHGAGLCGQTVTETGQPGARTSLGVGRTPLTTRSFHLP
jgi:hypothetical protein